MTRTWGSHQNDDEALDVLAAPPVSPDTSWSAPTSKCIWCTVFMFARYTVLPCTSRTHHEPTYLWAADRLSLVRFVSGLRGRRFLDLPQMPRRPAIDSEIRARRNEPTVILSVTTVETHTSFLSYLDIRFCYRIQASGVSLSRWKSHTRVDFQKLAYL